LILCVSGISEFNRDVPALHRTKLFSQSMEEF
jgi:hypothetical protein